jgi:hypothetical protein
MKRSQLLLLFFATLIVPAVAHAQAPWSGIISTSRATDWTQVGAVPGSPGSLPDASWTQCGSTVPAGTSAATITSDLAGCAKNTYLLLGPGTFILSGQIKFPLTGHVALRGSGANSTFIVISAAGGTGCQNGTSAICASTSDIQYNESISNLCAWTAGYSQASNSLTLSNSLGNCPSAIQTTSASEPTILVLEQCETGLSASSASAACTGNEVDNSQLFACGQAYGVTSTTVGCASEGTPGTTSGNQTTNRGHMEMTVATAYNSGTGVVTIATPLHNPDWQSGRTPRVWIQQSISDVGVENLAIDDSSGGTNDVMQFFGAYQWWVSGVKITNFGRWGIELWQVTNGTVMNSYIYHSTGADSMGIRSQLGSNNLFVNNIIDQVFGMVVMDGPSSGNAFAYNFCINSNYQSDFMRPCFVQHGVNAFDLFEGNIGSSHSDDGQHGTQTMITRFRNFFPGWESCANGNCGSTLSKDAGTNPVNDFYAARYQNDVANVLGTPGYHTTYQDTTGSSAHSIQQIGVPNGGTTPYDPLAKATLLNWGNYDTVSATVRWCGNSSDANWSSMCGSASEVPTGASTYPNSIPTKGDLSAGQGALPASLIFSSEPSWFGSIPWPPIGPDVSSGNVGQCTGAWGYGVANIPGQFGGLPATSNSQCVGTSLATAWAGHVNAIPAMNCYLNVMGGRPDGTDLAAALPTVASTGALNFDANVCYGSESGSLPPAPPTQLKATVN